MLRFEIQPGRLDMMLVDMIRHNIARSDSEAQGHDSGLARLGAWLGSLTRRIYRVCSEMLCRVCSSVNRGHCHIRSRG